MHLAVSIGDSLQQGFDQFFAFLPNILAFLVILLIGWIVAKIVQAVARKVLERLGVDRRVRESSARPYVERVAPDASPSNGLARILFVLVFVFFLISAIGALQVPALTDFMNDVLAYLPNVIAAIAIFAIAAAVAAAVGGGAAKLMGDTPTGKVVGTAAPALVMVIAVFMILQQLQIAEEIVQIAFAATMGALALGLALAFGLGGRPVAERMLEDAYRKGQEQREQVRRDTQLARDRGREQAKRGKAAVEGGGDVSGQPTTRVDPAGGSYRAT